MTTGPDEPQKSTDYILSEPGLVRVNQRCQHKGCNAPGMVYRYPSEEYNLPSETGFYCLSHAKGAGFCIGCGRFWGGVESFDFGDSGICDDCQRLEEEEYELYEEEYDPSDPYYST